MYDAIPYSPYFWSFGTTSFRMKEFNYAIERQLQLLNEFWELPEYRDVAWDKSFSKSYTDKSFDIYEIKNRYYDFMVNKKFIVGDDKTKYKAAREKTTSMVALGLIDENRRLNGVGRKILEISESKDYSSDNYLLIAKDSFVYFKQLLKSSRKVNDNIVRPFIVLLHLINELDFLSLEEFTYLLPLCVSENSTKDIKDKIIDLRAGKASVDEIIISSFMKKDNYKKAYDLFVSNNVDEELIITIGMNRKSGANGKEQYDKCYYDLYIILREVCVNKNLSKLVDVYNCCGKTKLSNELRDYLFVKKSASAIKKDPASTKSDAKIYDSKDEIEYKQFFFKMLHLSKAKSTLRDYFDINRRFINLTDMFVIEDEKVVLDIIPRIVINESIKSLYSQAFVDNVDLQKDVPVESICTELLVSENTIITEVNKCFPGQSISSMDDVKKILETNRLDLFNKLIDNKFTDEKLLGLLDKFKTRDDMAIQSEVTDNADVPTIFEYIIAIIWYKISERKGNILKYMNLDFDANLLPKHHAGSGESDIVYFYDKSSYYPEHSLLIEVTLMNPSAQKLNEDEPATRHLGEYRLSTGLHDSYCLFCAPTIPMNLISSFRNKATYEYFNKDGTDSVTDLKLIAFETDEMKYIIENKICYRDLYKVFDKAYKSKEKVKDWYQKCIVEEMKAI